MQPDRLCKPVFVQNEFGITVYYCSWVNLTFLSNMFSCDKVYYSAIYFLIIYQKNFFEIYFFSVYSLNRTNILISYLWRCWTDKICLLYFRLSPDSKCFTQTLLSQTLYYTLWWQQLSPCLWSSWKGHNWKLHNTGLLIATVIWFA